MLTIFRKGVQCDAQTLLKWIPMYWEMKEGGLPQNFSDFSEAFKNDVAEVFGNELNELKTIKLPEISQELEKMVSESILEKKVYFGEYSMVDDNQFVFTEKNEDIFFIGHQLSLNPLQLIRSRVSNFCKHHGISNVFLDEIIISVTEAAENAVKYSDVGPIYCEQRIENDEYKVTLINSIKDYDLSNEIDRGKFSENVSLMRGVLVMSKLLDTLNIERKSDLNRVEFIGSKKI